MRALHFSKGCYLGQEIVERIRSRGNVHRHLRPLELSGPLPAAGAELTPGRRISRRADHQCGRTAAQAAGARAFALGMIRSEAESAEPDFPIHGRDGPGNCRAYWLRRQSLASSESSASGD